MAFQQQDQPAAGGRHGIGVAGACRDGSDDTRRSVCDECGGGRRAGAGSGQRSAICAQCRCARRRCTHSRCTHSRLRDHARRRNGYAGGKR